jgi:endonuclease/exonuclease/phosphatase family metal-dependent hydrolase
MTDTPFLRVLTFNVRGFYHADGANAWIQRETLNIETIRRTAPHLVGLQEVQTGNMKAYDRDLTDYHWLAWPEYGNEKPYEWPAILWDPRRLRPLDSGGFWLSETPDVHSRSWDTDNIRSCQWIRFRDLVSGVEFVHANTHLDHRSELARIEGSRLIICRLDAELPGATVIATGDYNDVPGSATYRAWLDAGFSDAHVEAGCDDDPCESYTNHGWLGYPFSRDDDTPQRIDWIMLRGGVRAVSCEIVRDGGPIVWPSDHFPVVADVNVGSA